MKLSYVLPDPASYRDGDEFDGDLACLRAAGYDAVELQIADPAALDEERLRRSLDAAGYRMCAFQTGSTYYSRGNCLCSGEADVFARTVELLRRFVALAARFGSVIVFGSLQGRSSDEPDVAAGQRRIVQALSEIGGEATKQGVTVALEPLNHIETAYHHTIRSVRETVRRINQPGLRMMIDAFHMNIEEKDMLAPIAPVMDVLAHVHLSDTNRDVLGEGHWPTAAFLGELDRLGYAGHCSIGVYNTRRARRECIAASMDAVRAARKAGASASRRKES
jgi:sugar phosphate isomerase/epimerase